MGESMAGYGLNPEPLHGAGGTVRGLQPDAGHATKGFLDAVTDAGSAAHHAVLSGALSEFHGRWSVPANRLVHNVDAAGSQVQKVAVVCVDGDLQGQSELARAEHAATDQYGGLNRPINI